MSLSAGRSNTMDGGGMSIHFFDKRQVVLCPFYPSADAPEFAGAAQALFRESSAGLVSWYLVVGRVVV
jgi:hypothetical protein